MAEFLIRARNSGLSKRSFRKTGLIFIKENVSYKSTPIYSDEDYSMTRTNEQFCSIFKEAGFVIKEQFFQKDMPKELNKIRCYILKPR